jgi:hypothetical protein
MRYRKLTPDGDYQFGHGQADFYSDQPEAPAQAVYTRLRLELGEWFLDTSDGTDWRVEVLGKYTASTRDMVIRARILGTPGISEMVTYASGFDANTRQYTFTATLNTVYGPVRIAETL